MHHLSNLQGLLLSALAWLVHCHRLRCHRFHFHSTTNDFDLQCISQIARFLMTWMRTPIDQISNVFDSLVSVTSIANTAIYISIRPRSFAPTSWSPCTYNGWHAPGVFSEFSISNASVWVDSWGHWGTGGLGNRTGASRCSRSCTAVPPQCCLLLPQVVIRASCSRTAST